MFPAQLFLLCDALIQQRHEILENVYRKLRYIYIIVHLEASLNELLKDFKQEDQWTVKVQNNIGRSGPSQVNIGFHRASFVEVPKLSGLVKPQSR